MKKQRNDYQCPAWLATSFKIVVQLMSSILPSLQQGPIFRAQYRKQQLGRGVIQMILIIWMSRPIAKRTMTVCCPANEQHPAHPSLQQGPIFHTVAMLANSKQTNSKVQYSVIKPKTLKTNQTNKYQSPAQRGTSFNILYSTKINKHDK